MEAPGPLFVVRKGGLGNQMFQVAAALLYSKQTGHPVVLSRELAHIHNPLRQEYADTVFRLIHDRLNIALDDRAIRLLEQAGYKVYPGEPGFEPWSVLPGKEPLILHGYFQYAPPLEAEKTWIQSWFLESLRPTLTSLTPLAAPSKCIGVHIRRGDYLRFSDVHPVLPLSYYEHAIHQALQDCGSDKTFVLFSDDIAWCKEQKLFAELPNCIWCEEQDEVKTLCRMIQCEGGFLCGNSTFSWWGAFLGAYRLGRPVYVPPESDWIRLPIVALFPTEWVRISV